MRPPMPSVNLSRRSKIALSVVAILIVLIIVLLKLSGVYVNYLWYRSLGHRNVYTTMLWTKVSLFFIFGILMALIIGGNVLLAYVVKPPFRPMSAEQQSLQNYVQMVEPKRKWILAAIMVISLLAAGASAQGDWATWQLFLHGGTFHVKDPQFGRDISFYAWDYPVYRLLLSFGFTAVIFSLILAIGVHYLTGAIRLQTPGPKITVAARRQLTILVFVFMLLKAIAYWLDRYGLVFSTRSKFTGASYTDVHSLLPAKTILFWITIILALGVLASLWTNSALLPGIGFVVLLVISIIISSIYPAIVQSVSVSPNASTKEERYIERNIDATREGYDIVTRDKAHPDGTVAYQTYNVAAAPNTDALNSKTSTTVDNIRILDPNVISPTFTNQQKIGRPYAFTNKLNIDRYTLSDGATHDYVVAVREQARGSNLTGSQDNWINQHTVYTHGYGFVAAEADVDITNGDSSDYTEGNIPPKGPLNSGQPDVYYGQLMNDYSIVGAKGTPREFDTNGGTDVTYHGKGGVSLGSVFTRLAFAIKYHETSFLLNDTVSASGAKIIFNRDPRTLLKKVAPFLTVDNAPYPVVDSKTGHIVWMLDGYTTMANYPYSERQSLSTLTQTTRQSGQRDTQINYIRNSVKATVDAYDGTVHLYDWDSSDPVLKAWMSVFPGLVQPKSDLPPQLLAHVRYPQDLFDVQRALLAQYHISNPIDSYNGKGRWDVPADPFGSGADQPPYYVLASQPGTNSKAPQFQLTTPMVVNGATNLSAYISANCDPTGYGTLSVLQVPSQATVYGPSQVANDLKTTGVITKDIQQLDNGQSSVVHGNLLTLPVGNTFLYVEPLYVQSNAANSFPTLQRVLVRYGNGKEIGYEDTLDQAIGDIVENRDPGSLVTTGQQNGNGATQSGSKSPTSSPPNSSPPSSGPPSSNPPNSTGPTSPPSGGNSGPPPSSTQQQTLNQIQQELARQRKLLEKLIKELASRSPGG